MLSCSRLDDRRSIVLRLKEKWIINAVTSEHTHMIIGVYVYKEHCTTVNMYKIEKW